MLRKFTVTNYKNFQGTVCMDFTDVRKYDFNTQCVKNGLLNKALVLGKNGIGKTNLGLALFDISYTLTENMVNPLQVMPESFLNAYSNERFATFEYEFQQGNDIIVYTYRKNTPTNIIYESMSVNGENIFKRDGSSISNYDGLKKLGLESLQVRVSNGSLAVLRFIYNNTVSKPDSPIAFVMNFVSRMLYFRSTQDGNAFIGFKSGGELIENYILSHNLVSEFQAFLKDTAGLKIELQKKNVPGMQDYLVQKFKNRIIVFNTIASSGTKALMLLFYWMKHFGNVSFLYMDEFDAFYHYDLAENVLRLIMNDDSYQAILTTHNTDLVDNNLMRPDCYLILTESGLRSMPERTLRELREGHNLRKLLRGGEFDE